MCIILLVAILIGLVIFFLVFGVEVYEGYQIYEKGKGLLSEGSTIVTQLSLGNIDFDKLGKEAMKIVG